MPTGALNPITLPSAANKIYNTLIRVHHIRSQKKISRLRKAARSLSLDYVLLKSNGAPGMMYAEGSSRDNVQAWVKTVERLRYKEYSLVKRVAEMEVDGFSEEGDSVEGMERFEEVGSLGLCRERMQRRGVLAWWRCAMGFDGERRREEEIGGSGG